ncbi:hypothetical protein [Streptomyces sp. NPDC087297]|uniref:hypothetical protein n=1 Tax=Streptomyces sp. NPDC087297 TaxID=3365778 RepID=UPI0037FDA8E7
MTPSTDTAPPAPAGAPSPFAMYQAALIRRQLTDAEWHELRKTRPHLAAALAARERSR